MLKKLINRFYKNYKFFKIKYFSFYRKFGLKSNQYYLVSFPKSGNTWLRIILSNILSGEKECKIFLNEIQSFIPDSHIRTQLFDAGKPGSIFSNLKFQFVKSHEPYSKFYKGKNVIYIVRDGRDVVNSYYHYLNARSEKIVKIQDLIMKSDKFDFGSWNNHIESWYNGEHGKFILVRYENLLQNTENEIKRLLNSINFEVPEEVIKKAIKNSAFKKLRSLENKEGVVYKNKLRNKSNKFFRKGISGDWKNSFTKQDLKYFNSTNFEAMKLSGYKLEVPESLQK